MFSVGNADTGGADIEMAVLVVAAVRCRGVEVEFDIHSGG